MLVAYLESYKRFVASLDIGVCPLLPTAFNLGRSDVKFLEYAAHGVATICQALAPYNDTVVDGETALLFRDHLELERHLHDLIETPSRRKELVDAAYRYVVTQRLEGPHAVSRLQFYQDLVAASPSSGVTSREDLRALLDAHVPWTDHGHYAKIEFGPMEKLLYNGLLSLDDREEAARCFTLAVTIAPEFYLPHLYLGHVLRDVGAAVESLERALAANPRSCNAAFLLGMRHMQRGDRDRAEHHLLGALAVAPNFALAHEGLGMIAERRRRFDLALGHYQRAVDANTHFTRPGTRVANYALEQRDAEGAAARSSTSSPGSASPGVTSSGASRVSVTSTAPSRWRATASPPVWCWRPAGGFCCSSSTGADRW